MKANLNVKTAAILFMFVAIGGIVIYICSRGDDKMKSPECVPAAPCSKMGTTLSRASEPAILPSAPASGSSSGSLRSRLQQQRPINKVQLPPQPKLVQSFENMTMEIKRSLRQAGREYTNHQNIKAMEGVDDAWTVIFNAAKNAIDADEIADGLVTFLDENVSYINRRMKTITDDTIERVRALLGQIQRAKSSLIEFLLPSCILAIEYADAVAYAEVDEEKEKYRARALEMMSAMEKCFGVMQKLIVEDASPDDDKRMNFKNAMSAFFKKMEGSNSDGQQPGTDTCALLQSVEEVEKCAREMKSDVMFLSASKRSVSEIAKIVQMVAYGWIQRNSAVLFSPYASKAEGPVSPFNKAYDDILRAIGEARAAIDKINRPDDAEKQSEMDAADKMIKDVEESIDEFKGISKERCQKISDVIEALADEEEAIIRHGMDASIPIRVQWFEREAHVIRNNIRLFRMDAVTAVRGIHSWEQEIAKLKQDLGSHNNGVRPSIRSFSQLRG